VDGGFSCRTGTVEFFVAKISSVATVTTEKVMLLLLYYRHSPNYTILCYAVPGSHNFQKVRNKSSDRILNAISNERKVAEGYWSATTQGIRQSV
jgi:hypothetical protein